MVNIFIVTRSMTKKILIVGGGVIGCAMLEHLSSYEGISCILIEKNQSLVTGASSGNSGILHTGFDAPSIGYVSKESNYF